jgi:hypothetical protein
MVPVCETPPLLRLDTATRVSRVSFATDPRPSTDSRRTAGTSHAARAFHSAYTPPVPSLPAVYSPKEKVKLNPDEVDVNLSPRQTAGPLTLSPEDIRVRIQSGKDDDDVLPALASKSLIPSLTMQDSNPSHQ